MRKFLLLVLLSSSLFALDFGSFFKMPDMKYTSTSSVLNDKMIAKGLKEALEKGVKRGVNTLAKKNGYLKNARIPLPKALKNAAKMARKVGANKKVDDFIRSMNRAASSAVPKTAKIFMNAIGKMNIEDAKKILQGKSNAATSYLSSKTSSSLQRLILPIIQKSMKSNDVAFYYSKLSKYYTNNLYKNVNSSSLIGIASSFGVKAPKIYSQKDLEKHITNKAVQGLFKMIAKEERAIRKNPLKRTSKILKRVFQN